jgi:hypothetical protein
MVIRVNTERLEDVLGDIVLVGHSHEGLERSADDSVGTVGVVRILPHRHGRLITHGTIVSNNRPNTNVGIRTGSAVTRFHASSLVMSHASPKIGSKRVKKLQGVAPVRPLFTAQDTNRTDV